MRLKPKEREFVKTLVHKNNENGTQTVQEVFAIEDPNYAGVKAHRMIRTDKISQAIEIEKETLKSALEKEGITPERIAKKINVLLNAKEPIYKNNNESGEIEHVGDKIDFTAVDKGLKHAKDIYGVEDLDSKPKGNTTYNYIFNAETQADIKLMEEKIKARLIQPNEQKSVS